MKDFKLLRKLFKEEKKTGKLKMNLTYARRPIIRATRGGGTEELTLLEALFSTISVTQAVVLFKDLRERESKS